MANYPSTQLLAYLRTPRGRLSCDECLRRVARPSVHILRPACRSRRCESTAVTQDSPESFRKHLKEDAKARRNGSSRDRVPQQRKSGGNDKWQLTVGIEVHAELNTTKKLFSEAQTSISELPNTRVARFDAALPGTQPQIQVEAVIPAIRAALALGCTINAKSGWDRKHYFWWDQPNGYQITQYYTPFAVDGLMKLYADDGIDENDYPSVEIRIKQIQLEQDTAKTVLQPPTRHLLDFNRVSHPLIEIITLPDIHHPKTAAALVRKLQAELRAVNANTTGMEMGGLRADVNVSVRLRASMDDRTGLSYGGVTGLGQRTEIKNLSSFKAVEDAIIAERDRQICVLEQGGTIEGETRGWSLGNTETRRIRGKEGEVDYRYMPDPDLPPLILGSDLLEHLRTSQPQSPDRMLENLIDQYNLSKKDAATLCSLDEGERVEYFGAVVEHVVKLEEDMTQAEFFNYTRLCANWVIQELGAQLTAQNLDFCTNLIPAETLAYILHSLQHKEITLPSAKTLLYRALQSDAPLMTPAILMGLMDDLNIRLVPLSNEEYMALAEKVVQENTEMAQKVWQTAQTKPGKVKGKLMWFVGQMVKHDQHGRVEPDRAELAARRALNIEL